MSIAAPGQYNPSVDVLALSGAMSEELAGQLTCDEAEAYARLLAWAGSTETAVFFLAAHAASDGDDDLHGDDGQLRRRLRALLGRDLTAEELESLRDGRGR